MQSHRPALSRQQQQKKMDYTEWQPLQARAGGRGKRIKRKASHSFIHPTHNFRFKEGGRKIMYRQFTVTNIFLFKCHRKMGGN